MISVTIMALDITDSVMPHATAGNMRHTGRILLLIRNQNCIIGFALGANSSHSCVEEHHDLVK
jgi:hypothetical protein